MPDVGKIDIKKRWGRDWVILLLSLLLAFFIWLVHNLSLEYSVYIQYRPTVTTDIKGHSNTATSNETLILRGKARGFYILKHKNYRDNATPVSFSIDSRVFKLVPGEVDLYRVSTDDLREKLTETLGENFSIEFIESDYLTFYYPLQLYKRVPVVPQSTITYENQYMKVGNIVLSPDSVTVYGTQSALNDISAINTRTINLSNVDKSVNGIIQVEPVKNIRIGEEKIYYSLTVERYVENTKMVKVDVINLPPDRTAILLPSYINVTYRAPFRSDKGFSEDNISFVVDYNDVVKSRSSKVVPKFYKFSRTLYSYEIDPLMVECILMVTK